VCGELNQVEIEFKPELAGQGTGFYSRHLPFNEAFFNAENADPRFQSSKEKRLESVD